MSEPVNVPAGLDVYITSGDMLGQIKSGSKLPSRAVAWMIPGSTAWMAVDQYPYGQKTEQDEADEKESARQERLAAREAAAKFDESGRVRSLAEHFKALLKNQGTPSAGEKPRAGPPPGYRS
jgi:hypothetical protein